MTYYKDLTSHSYLYDRPDFLNVGWLEDEDFPVGEVSENFINLLSQRVKFLADETRGLFKCSFCKSRESKHLMFGSKGVVLGSACIVVFSSNTIYITPNLLLHYCKEHKYLPPKEFVDTIEKQDPFDEELYKHDLLKHNVTYSIAEPTKIRAPMKLF